MRTTVNQQQAEGTAPLCLPLVPLKLWHLPPKLHGVILTTVYTILSLQIKQYIQPLTSLQLYRYAPNKTN